MGMTVGLHVQGDEKITTETTVHTDGKTGSFVATHIKAGESDVTLFIRDVADIDRLAFEFETLARTLREEYGWTPKH